MLGSEPHFLLFLKNKNKFAFFLSAFCTDYRLRSSSWKPTQWYDFWLSAKLVFLKSSWYPVNISVTQFKRFRTGIESQIYIGIIKISVNLYDDVIHPVVSGGCYHSKSMKLSVLCTYVNIQLFFSVKTAAYWRAFHWRTAKIKTFPTFFCFYLRASSWLKSLGSYNVHRAQS